MKTKNKTPKKFFIVYLSILLLLSASFVYLCFFSPIEWAAGACSGGYKSQTISLNEERIEEGLGVELSEAQLWQIKENWTWKGRNSFSSYIDEEGNVVKISGTKIWGDYFKWSYI